MTKPWRTYQGCSAAEELGSLKVQLPELVKPTYHQTIESILEAQAIVHGYIKTRFLYLLLINVDGVSLSVV